MNIWENVLERSLPSPVLCLEDVVVEDPFCLGLRGIAFERISFDEWKRGAERADIVCAIDECL